MVSYQDLSPPQMSDFNGKVVIKGSERGRPYFGVFSQPMNSLAKPPRNAKKKKGLKIGTGLFFISFTLETKNTSAGPLSKRLGSA
jgi:hypothetical protein